MQWIFTREELARTPSIAVDGWSVTQEQRMRLRGSAMIQSSGSRLALSQVTVATAAVYFHRFYTRRSFQDYDFEYVAAACIYLAGKVEDSRAKLHDIIQVCAHHNYGRENHVAEKIKISQQWREAIIYYEQFLIETLCFDLTVNHPHQLVLEFGEEIQASERVVAAAWAFANDSMRVPVCLMYHPQMVAAACMLLGFRVMREDFPLDPDTIWGQTLDKEPKLLQEITNVYTLSPRSES
ncbi:cyclin-like protein [Radiomyces spectabilis]|uniref:cyclin-like protein n=1 Tax=Radiomyces spectabilis TaxID=64574 RepID=UPI00221E7BBD|nr:cyclin-like protein [Radiomyces spectabilis]KAI8393408.1 cyclin-like protein [Radiomyces spectabilis]